MTIKTISTYEWTDLELDSGSKYALQNVNGNSFRLSTETTPSSDDDCLTICGSTIVALKAGDKVNVKPVFSSDLPLNISVQAL